MKKSTVCEYEDAFNVLEQSIFTVRAKCRLLGEAKAITGWRVADRVAKHLEARLEKAFRAFDAIVDYNGSQLAAHARPHDRLARAWNYAAGKKWVATARELLLYARRYADEVEIHVEHVSPCTTVLRSKYFESERRKRQ